MKGLGGICDEKCMGQGFSEEEKKFLRSETCSRRREQHCLVYPNPSIWWRPGFRCPAATHYRPDLVVDKKRGRVGQQKQKKK